MYVRPLTTFTIIDLSVNEFLYILIDLSNQEMAKRKIAQ